MLQPKTSSSSGRDGKWIFQEPPFKACSGLSFFFSIPLLSCITSAKLFVMQNSNFQKIHVFREAIRYFPHADDESSVWLDS